MNEQTRTLKTSDGRELFYRRRTPASPRGALLLIHGYAEHSGRWGWVMDRLVEAGLAVYAPDYRGHGRSVVASGRLGDLESMDLVAEELAAVWDALRAAHPGVPHFVYGHSMGGSLATLHTLRRQAQVRALIVSAPWVTVPDYASRLLVRVVNLLAAIAPRLPVQPFDYTQVSRDPEVIRAYSEDPLCYTGKTRARTGREMLRIIGEVDRRAAELTLPLLVLQGGDDRNVNLRDAPALYERAASADKTFRLFPGLRHEIHNEPEKQEVMGVILDWLESRGLQRPAPRREGNPQSPASRSADQSRNSTEAPSKPVLRSQATPSSTIRPVM
jgi:acylglycerol lipase